MKKSLIVLAALAATSAFAQSSVTIYGNMDISIGAMKGGSIGVNNGINYGIPQATGNAAASTFGRSALSTSVLGFRGVEDLGGGMAATFNLQVGGMDLSTGATALAFSRESNVGLNTGYGNLKIGRATSTACTTLCGFDANGISSGAPSALIGTVLHAVATRSSTPALTSAALLFVVL